MPTRRCDDIKELHPYVKELAEKLMAECKAQGLNVKVIDTYRSVTRQDYLYGQGRTGVPYARPGKTVTNAKGSAKSSYHQWRLAFDVIQNKAGDEYNTAILNKVGVIGKKLGLEWGGDWTNPVDRPHFQYTYGLTIKQLNAGAKIPSYTPKPVNPNAKSVKVTTTKVQVDCEVLDVEAVVIDDFNYIRLRGIDSKHIAIGYENGLATVNVRKPALASVPKEPHKLVGKSFDVEPSTTKINVCGNVVTVSTVNIEGNNFIKLRDIGCDAIEIDFINNLPTVIIR